jgi:hypothetical protein
LAENGYEIIAGENEIIFVDRRTWGLPWVMVGFGIVALVFVLLSTLGTNAAVELQSAPLQLLPPTAAAILAVAIWLISRIYRRRRCEPAEEVRDLLVLDLPSRVLRNRMGEVLAQLEDVRARMYIDWWTRGAMRVVVLSWLGGRRAIYRSFSRRRALDVLAFLEQRGLDEE